MPNYSFGDCIGIPGSGNTANTHSILVNGGTLAANQYQNTLYLGDAKIQPTGGIPHHLQLKYFRPGTTIVSVGQ